MNHETELVVAHYQENLNWLRRVPNTFTITVYDKGGESHQYPGARELPNTGREAHTYLHHIIERYDSLPALTVFCQGHPFDHAYDFRHTLRAIANNEWEQKPFFWLGHMADTDTPQGALFSSWSKNPDGHGLELEEFHRQLFNEPGPQKYLYFLGGQFVVTREVIYQREKTFYQKALELSVIFPEAAHCFERCWDRAFFAQASTRERMGEKQTLYLKPIKRLLGGAE